MGDVEEGRDDRGWFEKTLAFGASCSLIDVVQCWVLSLLGNHCEILISRRNLSWCLQTLWIKKIKISGQVCYADGSMIILVKKQQTGLVKMLLGGYVHYLRE